MRHLKATSDVVGVSGARRWSTATQSITGLSNTSHQSLPVNEDSRKISFVLQDQDNESIGSSKNSLSGAVSTTQHNNKIIWEQKNIINSTIQLFTLLWTRNYSFCCILQLIQSQKTVLLLRVFLIVFVWSWLVVSINRMLWHRSLHHNVSWSPSSEVVSTDHVTSGHNFVIDSIQ